MNCNKCLNGDYWNCVKGSCIHNSKVKSLIGALEGYFYRVFKAYRYIDVVICPSRFIQEKLEHHPQLKGKTVCMYNFVTADKIQEKDRCADKEDYVIYFGRYSKEKGIETLVQACRDMPHIKFVLAGKGPLEELVDGTDNIENRGFLTGEELKDVIKNARFSIYPSEWYENCPFSVMESIQYGTPVLGADIGGIPELIDDGITGELFESGNKRQLAEKIEHLWSDKRKTSEYARNCCNKSFVNLAEYARKYCHIICDGV